MMCPETESAVDAASRRQRERVQRFYDVNTSAFARFGQGAKALLGQLAKLAV